MQKTTYNQQGSKEIQQDNQYEFPYHYLPKISNGAFTQHAQLHWGYEYYSYIQFVTNLLVKEQPQSVIDVGCGDGRLLFELQKTLKNTKLFGVDTSERSINLAKAMNPAGQYDCIDIGEYQSENKYSFATLIETMEHIKPENIRHFLEGIHRNLETGGQLIITVPSTNLPVSKKHYQHFTVSSIQDYLQDLFIIKESWYLNQKGIKTKLIEALFCNRFFTLEWKRLRKWLYKYYTAKVLPANQHNGMRVCVKCIKL